MCFSGSREAEQHFVAQGGHDGMEAARADVLHALVRLAAMRADLLMASSVELERRAPPPRRGRRTAW